MLNCGVTKVISHLAIIFASCLMRFGICYQFTFLGPFHKVIVQKVKVRVLAPEPLTDATVRDFTEIPILVSKAK